MDETLPPELLDRIGAMSGKAGLRALSQSSTKLNEATRHRRLKYQLDTKRIRERLEGASSTDNFYDILYDELIRYAQKHNFRRRVFPRNLNTTYNTHVTCIIWREGTIDDDNDDNCVRIQYLEFEFDNLMLYLQLDPDERERGAIFNFNVPTSNREELETALQKSLKELSEMSMTEFLMHARAINLRLTYNRKVIGEDMNSAETKLFIDRFSKNLVKLLGVESAFVDTCV